MITIVGPHVCYNGLDLHSPDPGSLALNQKSAMNGFLREVERRALRMAELATGDREDALEIVQEAMFGLVRRYADRIVAPVGLEVGILHSRINDFHRHRRVRRRFLGFLSTAPDPDDAQANPLDKATAGERENPVQELQRTHVNDTMMTAIGHLPARQQQAFLLRAWEGLSVRDTAIAMRCSEGSVKTHYSRAIQALREALAEFNNHENE